MWVREFSCRSSILFARAFVLLIGFLASWAPLLVQAEPPAGLQTAAAELHAWRASFSNIRLAYSFTQKDLKSNAVHPNSMTSVWTWSDIGSMCHESSTLADGKFVTQSSMGADVIRHKAFAATWIVKDDRRFLAELRIFPMHDSRSRFTDNVMPLFKLWSPPTGKWLDEILLESGKLAEPLQIDGIDCLTIILGDYRLALDPTQSCLPRRVEWIEVSGNVGWDYHVTEFGQASGTPFPRRGTLTFSDDRDQVQEWLVKECELNLNLPATAFDAPTPETGTLVLDATTQNVFTYGKEKQKSDFLTPQSIVTNQSSTWLVSIALTTVSLIVMGVGLYFLKRH